MLNEDQQYVGRISALMNPVTYVIINVATLLLIWTGAVRVDRGYITQGEVVALVSYMSQILVELIKLANLIVSVTKAIACGKRVADILDVEEGLPQTERTDTTLKDGAQYADMQEPVKVEFADVDMAYHKSGENAVSGISFQARRGQTIGIIGGTGSGKSTVVNLIPRFYDVTKGAVRIDGKDVRDYDIKELRGKIGVVMQKAVLFKGTIRENLKWGDKHAPDSQLMDAVRSAQAMDVIEAKENGMDEMIGQGGKNLSGGQRQRLTIARALDYNPTIFVVSQRTSSVQSADFILVLDDGKLAGKGTHEELLKTCGVYQEIYASQFRSGDEDTAGKQNHADAVDEKNPAYTAGSDTSGKGAAVCVQ